MLIEEAFRAVVNDSQQDQAALVVKLTHFLLDVREVLEDLLHLDLLVVEDNHVLAELVQILHEDVHYFVQVAIGILDGAATTADFLRKVEPLIAQRKISRL